MNRVKLPGYVTMKCAELTGLKEGIPVLYGCGDQMAQSIGNGVYQEGKLSFKYWDRRSGICVFK